VGVFERIFGGKKAKAQAEAEAKDAKAEAPPAGGYAKSCAIVPKSCSVSAPPKDEPR